MTDDTKADALRSVLIWIALTVVLVTAPTWAPMIDEAMEPSKVIEVSCKRWM